jgi:2-keto-3-deoxy-L-rhamnonate aldolase RhmA
MMTPSDFRAALERGDKLRGIWRTLPGDAMTEIIARAGYDFQIFDREHGALSWAEVQSMVRINNAIGRVSLVRLGDRSPVAAQRALDAGAQGLVYPQVNSVEEISLLAENLAFAPQGRRGFNPFVPAFGYGAQRSPDDCLPLLLPIIETKAGLAALQDICSHPAVDVVYLGAYDLSVQLGVPGDVESPVVMAALEAAVEVCQAHQCAVGLMAGSDTAVKRWVSAGTQVFLHGVDGGILHKAFAL